MKREERKKSKKNRDKYIGVGSEGNISLIFVTLFCNICYPFLLDRYGGGGYGGSSSNYGGGGGYSDWKDESSTSGGAGGGYKDEKDDIPTGGNTWDWDEG